MQSVQILEKYSGLKKCIYSPKRDFAIYQMCSIGQETDAKEKVAVVLPISFPFTEHRSLK